MMLLKLFCMLSMNCCISAIASLRLSFMACRAAISKERLRALPNGDVELELKRSWTEGVPVVRHWRDSDDRA